MHIALFFVVNLVVAGAIGVMAFVDGHGPGGIALRVAGTFLALQLAYVIWLGVVAWIAPPSEPDPSQTKAAPGTSARSGKIDASARDNAQ